jgi:hypothetical protein
MYKAMDKIIILILFIYDKYLNIHLSIIHHINSQTDRDQDKNHANEDS